MTGAISLTFDDGLPQHLDHAIPVLNGVGLAGTFYTHLASPTFVTRQAEWLQAVRDGHELGNHTVFHPADARKEWVRPGNAIDWYSLDRMKLEMEFANRALMALDGHEERTFAYPCCNSFVGHRGWGRRLIEAAGMGNTRIASWLDRSGMDFGSTLLSYESIVEQLFVAGRGGGLVFGQEVPPVSQWRRSHLLSVAVEDRSLLDLQRHVDDAMASHTWAILQFHGVGGGHRMNCTLDVFADFASWLRDVHSDRVLTVMQGARMFWPTRLENKASSRLAPCEKTLVP